VVPPYHYAVMFERLVPSAMRRQQAAPYHGQVNALFRPGHAPATGILNPSKDRSTSQGPRGVGFPARLLADTKAHRTAELSAHVS